MHNPPIFLGLINFFNYFNCIITAQYLYNVGFGIVSSDKGGSWIGESIGGNGGKRQYDGSFTFSFDASNKDFNDYIEIQKWWGHDDIILNYLSLEFYKSYTFFDYINYKKAF